MRLLLATAKADLRLALELLLSEQPGVEVVGSASESDGLAALIRTSKPDMLVVDWDLPGRPIATILAEREPACLPPNMIILTSSNLERQRALDAGADGVVLKGAPPDMLLQTFAKVRSATGKTTEKGDCL